MFGFVGLLPSIGKVPQRARQPRAFHFLEQKPMNLKALRQRDADLRAEIARASKDRAAIGNSAVKEKRSLTDDERTKFVAAGKQIETLQAQLAENKELLEAAEAANEAERNWRGATGDADAEATAQAAATARVSVKDRREDDPNFGFKSLGEQLAAVRAAASQGGRFDERLKFAAAAAGANSDVPSEGGFLVRQESASALVERTYATGQVSSRVFRMPIGEGFDGVKIDAIDETSRATGSRFGGVRAYWVSQGDEITASKPKFRQISLHLEKIAALMHATDELLRDSTALESVATRVVPKEINFQVEDAIINGDGAGKPLGVVGAPGTVSVAKETGQAATTFVFNNVKKMWARMWAPSRANAVWFINQDVEPQLYSMSETVGTGGVPVYLPPSGAAAQPFATLFGRQVIPIEYCQTLGTVGDVILADMSQYVAIDKGGVEQAVSMHVRFIYDEQTFRWIYRVDGEPMWQAALTPKNGTSNTLSPYVTLATRS